MKETGCLVISLDFELLWGVFDLVDYEKKESYFENTRKVIPDILLEFDRHHIHATWAVVGMLFNNNWQDWEKNKPRPIPEYYDPDLSAYRFGDSIASQETEKMVFAPDLIKKISEMEGQEIASHTYSHYYCMEEGQSLIHFEKDLQKAIEIADEMGIKIKSLVLPRNQLKMDYLPVCAELGIESVRSNPDFWYWKDIKSEAFHIKAARSGDAYFPFGDKTYAPGEMEENKRPLEQKASRFLRPVEGNQLLRKLKLNRIKNEMTYAAKNRRVYHLWWHPHNFGQKPEESLSDLKEILVHFDFCRKEHGFKSMNMMELKEVVKGL